MTWFMKRAASDRGITLLELMIAILVLSIGTLACFRTLDQSRREIGGEIQRHLAQTAPLKSASMVWRGAAACPNRCAKAPMTGRLKPNARKPRAGCMRCA